MMPGHVWSEREEVELRRLFAAGLSHGAMARATGHSKDAVTTKLGRMGLKRPNPVHALPHGRRVKQRAGKVTLARLASLE